KSGDFQALQQRLDQPLTRGVRYVLFDLMAVSGRSVRKAPLDERRAGLKELLVGRRGPLRLSRELTWNDDELLQRACSSGLEGIISKRRSAPYRSGRTMEWRKTKCDMRQELAIVG